MNTYFDEKKKDFMSTDEYIRSLSAAESTPYTDEGAVAGGLSGYDKQLEKLYNDISTREDFSYDVNADALYKQYRDEYQNMGKLASRDAMGQASALTGGYASSYAQSVGQQQYDAYLQRLGEVMPELYGQARQSYDAEGKRLGELYSMTAGARDYEYDKQMSQASQMSQYGDFSGYKELYGQEQGALMENTWLLQNADLALQLGLIDQAGYNQLMGIAPSSGGYYGSTGPKSESGSYNLGELLEIAGAGVSKEDIEKTLADRRIDISDKAVQADIKWALRK